MFLHLQTQTNKTMTKKTKKHTLLKGEGSHQHTLYGDELLIDDTRDFTKVVVKSDSLLIHETPNGSKGEHETLQISKGEWVMGRQVEYNPFEGSISAIWD